jgi:hypothetical protein
VLNAVSLIMRLIAGVRLRRRGLFNISYLLCIMIFS